MNRRELLKAAGIGTLAIGMMPQWGQTTAHAADAPAIEVDVLVVGGGTAGSIAAIQAARAGAKTMLLEMTSQLGGTITSGGVDFPGLFHAWGKQVIAGIGWEMVTKAVELDGGTMPDFKKLPPPGAHWQHQVRLNGPIYTLILEEACVAAGAAVAYYEFPLSVRSAEAGWLVESIGAGTRRMIAAKQLIDCTGGADVVGMLNLPRLREPTIQPGTLRFKLAGYDPKTLDRPTIQQRYREAMAAGQLKEGDFHKTGGAFMGFLAAFGENAQHIFGADSSNSITRTEANLKGRASLLRLLRFVRSLPGCEKARLVFLAPETGVRETYRIVGQTQVTRDDYVSGRVFEDAVCHSFYPIDLHDKDGVVPRPLPGGIVPTIPLGALIPKDSRNLLVAGRSVSSDRLANSALRVQASCMAMGQAAGGAAALAAKRRSSPGQVPLSQLKDLLRQHGAIVPEA